MMMTIQSDESTGCQLFVEMFVDGARIIKPFHEMKKVFDYTIWTD